MESELKKAIVDFVLDNKKEFQLNNATIHKFRNYIYDSTGKYLIGGENVSRFIIDFIKIA